MSNQTNEILLERAYELAEEFVNHPSRIDDQLFKAIETNNYDELYRLITVAEGFLSQQHFYDYNVLGDTDVF